MCQEGRKSKHTTAEGHYYFKNRSDIIMEVYVLNPLEASCFFILDLSQSNAVVSLENGRS